MKENVMWLYVTDDEYQNIIAFADTAEELSRITGISPNTIHGSVSKCKKGLQKKCRFIRLVLEE